jgi:hypothetical protein
MWQWLWNFFRRLRTGPIRTLDDLFRLIRRGIVRPRVYQVGGGQQVADLFAETGLSPEERAKVLMRSFPHPAGIRMYVHTSCAERFRQRVAHRGEVIFAPETEEWTPQRLIGRFRDVTHCDECGLLFTAEDAGYLAYWITSAEQFRLWQEVQREQRSGERA